MSRQAPRYTPHSSPGLGQREGHTHSVRSWRTARDAPSVNRHQHALLSKSCSTPRTSRGALF